MKIQDIKERKRAEAGLPAEEEKREYSFTIDSHGEEFVKYKLEEMGFKKRWLGQRYVGEGIKINYQRRENGTLGGETELKFTASEEKAEELARRLKLEGLYISKGRPTPLNEPTKLNAPTQLDDRTQAEKDYDRFNYIP